MIFPPLPGDEALGYELQPLCRRSKHCASTVADRLAELIERRATSDLGPRVRRRRIPIGSDFRA